MPPSVQFFVRTQRDPLIYLHSIRAAIASVASDNQISNSGNGAFTLKEALERDAQYSRQRLFSILFDVFSALALALALVGIFSVVAYSVAQCTCLPPTRLRTRIHLSVRNRRVSVSAVHSCPSMPTGAGG
jgi:hypothetical protein